ncbi:hypothetical protein LTR74_016620 [Friedmanniomyces endolithicus]|nr:hypothetical protein LTR74_016620 [Friedmanniomyces endolithicus]
MKPTFNTIAGGGIKVASIEFDTIGYFARCMEDLQLISDVFSLPAKGPIKRIPPKEAREGFVKSPFCSFAGLGTIAVMEEAAEMLRKHGVAVEDVDLAYGSSDAAALTDIFKVIFVTVSGAWFCKDYLMDTTTMKLFPAVHAFVDDAPEYPREQVRQAFEYYAALRPALDKIATRYSALITPSAIDEAPLGIGDMGSPIFNSVWTGARMPVIQMPAFAGPNAMPIGLSLIARTYCDQHPLSIAMVLAEPLMREGGWEK